MFEKQIAAFYLIVVISFLAQYVVNGSGMIEVFRWKQMDFYNRGRNVITTTPERPDGRPTLPTLPRPNKGPIIFPDQYRHKRETKQKMTSRDHPITVVGTRFNAPTSFNGVNYANDSSYIPYSNVPMGATMDNLNGRLYVTMPRRRTGIPSTLNFIDMRRDSRNPSPKLHAYPDFETNEIDPNNLQANTNRLISVYRTTIDACKRLWFIDTGMLEYPGNRMQIQRPTIWIMDLNTDRVIQRFQIPETIAETGRGLASLEIDVNSRNCDAAFAYIPDLVYNRLHVYSFAENRIWSFSHNYFNFDPVAGDLNIGGQQFRWDDGIFSITQGPLQTNGYRQVYFHAMASTNEFMVSSQVLQNEANAARSDHGNDFQLLGSRGNNRQSTMHEYDPKTGVIFYDEIQRNGIGCWNTKTPFSQANHGTVMEDAERMIYPSDLTIDEQGTIWVMSNSMPIFIYSNLDTNVYNFRIWKQNVHEAVKGTICG